MIKSNSILTRILIIAVVFVQTIGFSVAVFSEHALASESSDPIACPTYSGTTKPTGSSSSTFSFNPETCLWENAYYTWDPATKVRSAKYDQTPYLNAEGTAWEYVNWYYSPASGTYKKNIISNPIVTEQPASNDDTSSGTTATPTNSGSPTGTQNSSQGGHSIGNTGYDSDNTINNNTQNSVDYDVNNNTQILTQLNSNATSGDAWIFGNTNGGSATSGNAEVVANYLNMIQSSWDPNNSPINTFNVSLQGGLSGDVLFDPNSVLNTGPNSNNTINNNQDNDLNINISDNASIDNDINLIATSGDATVSSNTNAGDATSGDATAVANLFNLINSNIASGQSFIGNINIYDDFNGDILLPTSVLSMLRSSGPNSSNSINNSDDNNVSINAENNYSINTDYDLDANSGNASVNANTNAGDATSGDASTNIQHADVVGQSSSGLAGLLVFVNVLGQWTGGLWDGTGLSSIYGTGPYSTNNINSNSSTDINANFENNYDINNNLNVNATSGDARVTHNTNAGDATSGDASAAANVVNLVNSDLTFDNWFGVLFLNVFGEWTGSFGVDTDAGESNKNNVDKKSVATSASNKTSVQGSTADTSDAFRNSSSTANASTYYAFANSTNSADNNDEDQEDKDSGTSSTSTLSPLNDEVNGNVASLATDSMGIDDSLIGWSIIFATLLGGIGYLNRARLMTLLGQPEK